MTREEFVAGVKKVEAALQGGFDANFVGYLWKYFGREDAAYWGRICSTMCQSAKPARLLVFRDFLQVGINERGRAHDKRKVEESRGRRYDGPQKIDIVAIAEGVARKTGLPIHKHIAEDLRKRRDEAS